MTEADETAVRAVAERHAAAWNRHDMRDYAALFAEDADCITAIGTRWRGRDEIERAMAQHHATVFRATRLTNRDVAVRFLAADIALAHITWGLEGMLNRAGETLPPREGMITLVVRRGSDGWRIASFQNTDKAAPRSDLTSVAR